MRGTPGAGPVSAEAGRGPCPSLQQADEQQVINSTTQQDVSTTTTTAEERKPEVTEEVSTDRPAEVPNVSMAILIWQF